RPAQPECGQGEKLRARSRGECQRREDLEVIDGAADVERQLQEEEDGREEPGAPERRPEEPGDRERDQSPARRQLRDDLQTPENDLRKTLPGVSLARFEETVVQTAQVRGEAALDGGLVERADSWPVVRHVLARIEGPRCGGPGAGRRL